MSYLGLSQIEITKNIAYERPTISIYVFSSLDYRNVKLEKTPDMVSVASHSRNIKLCFKEQVIDGYCHIFDITFVKKELVCQSLELLYQNEKITLPIGMFQTISLESSSHIESFFDYQDNVGKMNIHNHLYHPLYLISEKVVSINKKHTFKMVQEDSRKVIYSDALWEYQTFSYKLNSPYHQVGGIIQTKFQTSLEEYTIYTTYYISDLDLNKIIKEGIDTSYLKAIKR